MPAVREDCGRLRERDQSVERLRSRFVEITAGCRGGITGASIAQFLFAKTLMVKMNTEDSEGKHRFYSSYLRGMEK